MKLKYIFPIISLSFLFLTTVFSTPSHASPVKPQQKEVVSSTQPSDSSPVQARLISEEDAIQPGRKFWVGIELNMADGWDTYWKNPGDSGFPTKITWNLPEKFEAGPIHWPYPEKFTAQSLVGFGYTHTVLLMAEITPPADLPSGEVSLSADVNWLACKEQCVPGQAKLQLTLPVTSSVPKKDNTVEAQFLKGRELLPKSFDANTVSVAAKKEEIVVNFKHDLGDIAEAFFVPEHQEMIDYNAPQTLKKGDHGYLLNIKRVTPEKDLPKQVKGVLLISEKGNDAIKAIDIDAKLSSHQHTPAMLHFKMALLFAFLGGLILNVMPCVLPVISLKIFSFIKMADQKRSEILKQGAYFTGGVLISFWVLSILLLILRASGEGIGWGFQLQEPMFVAGLILVLFLLGLSLFGLFELGTSLISVGSKVTKKGAKGSFMNGVLATLVATPCTGPLLGPALGLAMTLPPLSSLAIFTAMGLGMAAPYFLISAFPSLIRFLPKPGNWMITFKQIMGFLMMGTCAWLIWVFVGETNHMALFILLFALLLVSIGAWIYGKWGNIASKKRTRVIATTLAACLLVFSGGMTFTTVKANKGSSIEKVDGHWGAYSLEKIDSLRNDGKAVFVDFTAKWCLICQANKVMLHSSEIETAFQEKGVVPLVADWTMKDEKITEMLHKLGRSGVPVYVIYPSDKTQEPIILPQTLTKSVIQDYLKKLDTATVKN